MNNVTEESNNNTSNVEEVVPVVNESNTIENFNSQVNTNVSEVKEVVLETNDNSIVENTTEQSNNVSNVEEIKINNNETLEEIDISGDIDKLEEKEVVNTSHKSSSGIFIFILIILIVLFIYKIDDIVDYFDNNFSSSNSNNDKQSSDNSLDGFIKVDVNEGFIKVENIKFYNFKKKDGTVSYNYESTKKYTTTDELGIYVELYDIDKELLFKELISLSDVEKDVIRISSIDVTNDVYQSIYYVKVKTYTEDEKNKKTILTCKYNESNDMIVIDYKIVYNFTNDILTSYDVTKEFLMTDNNSVVAQTKDELELENNNALKYGITTNYSENKLTYSVLLDNVNEGFDPLYQKGTVKKTIINKESLKKWNCE